LVLRARLRVGPETGAVYQDLGERYFDIRDRTKLVRRLVRRLGDQVEIKEAA